MGRYSCYACKSEHGTDNMVAYCAGCYDRLRTALALAEKWCDEATTRLGERDHQLIADAARINALEAEVVKEHDLYLFAHRENMRAATIMMEQGKEIERLKRDMRRRATSPEQGGGK